MLTPRPGKAAQRPWAPLLLGGTLLLLAAAYVNMSYSPASTLAAWGIDPTALLPAVAQQWWQPEEEVVPVPPDLSLTAATPVYGQLQKAGPSEMVLGVRDALERGENVTLTLSFPVEWKRARLGGEKPAPPVKWCAVMFNDKYRIIYIKCPKTAGTPLIYYFGECVEGDPNNKDSCLTMIDVGSLEQQQHLLSVWQDYFVFGFTRNIFSRAISQYLYLTHFMPTCRLVSWDEFCVDPFILGDVCFQANQLGSPCCEKAAVHHYVHAVPQTHCFTTPEGASAVDWLGRQENFDEDFAALIDVLNARPGVPQLPRPEGGVERVNYNASPCEGATGAAAGDAGNSTAVAAAEGQPALAARRALRSAWAVREGILNPCDKMDFFRGEHAHCYGDLMKFFHEDASFLQAAPQGASSDTLIGAK